METICHSGPLWHVAYVAPRAEMRVCDVVRGELGYDSYLPLERVAGWDGPIDRPLMPRYLFVRVDPYLEAWQALLDVSGIVSVLMSNPYIPGHVPASWIKAMQKAEGLGVFDRTTEIPNNLKIGDKIRITEGPFEGHHALIAEFIARMRSATASKRARVLIEFMGRASTIELPVTSLEKLTVNGN